MSNNERQPSKKNRGLSRETRQLLMLIGGVAVALVLVVGITVGIFFSKNPQGNQPQDTSADTSVSDPTSLPGEVVEEENYNKDEFVLDVEKYGETVLDATEDAGEDYVKNTLFIGDSNTYRYMMYAQTTLDNDIGITSMGLQDVLTEECVKFYGYSKRVTIPEAVAIMQPQRIIICFGTNNAGGSWTAEYMAEQYDKVLDGIEKAWPYADIIISAVPPVAKAHQNTAITMTTIDSFNQAIAALAEERGCKFLNTTEVLKDPETGFAKEGYTIQDGIHLSQKGVEALFGYVRTHAYETQDRRPTPLKKVPKRDETQPYVITDENNYTGTVPGSKPEGPQILFAPNDASMGTIEGMLEQYVEPAKQCTEVTAKPKEGYKFAYWSCTVGSIKDVNDPKLSFTVPGNLTKDDKVNVTANFVKAGYTVTVTNTDDTAGTAGIVDKDNQLLSKYDAKPDEEIKLKAYINQGYDTTHKFVGWFDKDKPGTEPVSPQLEFTYKPSASINLEARFEKIGITVDVVINPDANAGSFKMSKDDTKVAVELTVKSGYTFSHWEIGGARVSGVTGTQAEFKFTDVADYIKDNKLTIVAVFTPSTPTAFKATANNDGNGTATAAVDAATNVATFTATAKDGFEFDGWYDAAGTKVSGDNPYKPTLTADLTLTAKFKAKAAEHTHDWNAWVSNNDGTHTRTCKGDATHTEQAACSGNPATCNTASVCTVCGYQLAAATSVHTPGAAATCIAPQTCTACGTELAAATGAHTPGAAATCSTPQTCTACGTELAAATGVHADGNGDGACDTCTAAMPASEEGGA